MTFRGADGSREEVCPAFSRAADAQIQRADYEGNRAELRRRYEELAPFSDNPARSLPGCDIGADLRGGGGPLTASMIRSIPRSWRKICKRRWIKSNG